MMAEGAMLAKDQMTKQVDSSLEPKLETLLAKRQERSNKKDRNYKFKNLKLLENAKAI